MKNLCAVTAMLVVFLGLVPATGVASPSPDVRDTIRAALETRAQALNPNVDLSKLDVSYDLGHSQGQAVVGAQLLAYEHDKIREFHQWAAARGIRLVDVAVSLNFHDVSITTNTARVQVDESIRIDWVYTSKPGEVTTTGLGTTHDMELVLVENRWLIRRDNYKDPFRESLGPDHLRADTHGQATPVPSEFSNTAAGQGGVSIMSSATYSRTAAAAYADKYCGLATGCGNSQTYNGAKYAQASDDCTNFVSQALGDPTEGGGAPQDSRRTYMTDWYYDYPTKTGSRAWVRADSFIRYLYSHPQGSTYNKGYLLMSGNHSAVSASTLNYPNGPVWELLKGDVIGYDFTADGTIDHSAVVAAYDPQGYPLVDAHNSDRYHAWWDLGTSGSTNYYLVVMSISINIAPPV